MHSRGCCAQNQKFIFFRTLNFQHEKILRNDANYRPSDLEQKLKQKPKNNDFRPKNQKKNENNSKNKTKNINFNNKKNKNNKNRNKNSIKSVRFNENAPNNRNAPNAYMICNAIHFLHKTFFSF